MMKNIYLISFLSFISFVCCVKVDYIKVKWGSKVLMKCDSNLDNAWYHSGYSFPNETDNFNRSHLVMGMISNWESRIKYFPDLLFYQVQTEDRGFYYCLVDKTIYNIYFLDIIDKRDVYTRTYEYQNPYPYITIGCEIKNLKNDSNVVWYVKYDDDNINFLGYGDKYNNKFGLTINNLNKSAIIGCEIQNTKRKYEIKVFNLDYRICPPVNTGPNKWFKDIYGSRSIIREEIISGILGVSISDKRITFPDDDNCIEINNIYQTDLGKFAVYNNGTLYENYYYKEYKIPTIRYKIVRGGNIEYSPCSIFDNKDKFIRLKDFEDTDEFIHFCKDENNNYLISMDFTLKDN